LVKGGTPQCRIRSVAACLDVIVASGGEIVQPIGGDAPEITAWFRDREGM